MNAEKALPRIVLDAVARANGGYSVFPCREKKPLVEGGYKAATRDHGQILRWWSEFPDAQIGVPTGHVNRLIVLDIDGEAGARWLSEKVFFSSRSQLPICCLPEIGLVWVVEIGLEVAEHRRHRIEPVVSNRHGLRVAQLRKCLHIETIIALLVVGLRRCEIGSVGLGFARQKTDVGIVAGFGQVVTHFELVFLTAKLAGNLCGKVIRKGQENLGTKGLQKRAP